jgi:uncharacterized membrane protein
MFNLPRPPRAKSCAAPRHPARARRAAVAIAIAMSCSVGSALAAPAYTITDLGTLPGFASSGAFGINAFGQVSGSASTDPAIGTGTIHGLLWTPTRANAIAGVFTDLGLATTGLANGMKINDYGQVAMNVGAPSELGYLWTPTSANATTGAAHPLALPFSGGAVYGLNNLGQVVGGGGAWGPYVWTPDVRNGTTGAINQSVAQGSNGPYLASGYNCHCTAAAINDAGQVAGSLFVGPYSRHIVHGNGAVTFPAMNPYDFGTFGGTDLVGPAFLASASEGSGGFESINAAGHAAGSRVFVDAQGNISSLPVYWDGAVFHGIGGGTGLSAHAINNRDDVVGETWLPSSPLQAGGFLYRGGVLTELRSLVDPALGWRIDHARAINDAGQIVGDGLVNGIRHAYLMTPNAADLSAQLLTTRSGLRYSAALHRWLQTVTVTNTGAAAVTGPISLVLTGLGSGVSLSNPTGATTAITPVGRPYVDSAAVSIGTGASAVVQLVFDDPQSLPITYGTQVLAGPGLR